MKNLKIVCLDADALGHDIDLSIFDKFGEFKTYPITKPEDTIKRLKDTDIVITNKVLITKDVIASTNLKLICVSATGINNVDIKAANEAGIPVKNVAGYSTNSVVQHTFSLLFELTNNTRYYSNYVSDGKWAQSELPTHLGRQIHEIAGKKFGIIGLGNVGQKVAQVAQTFGCEVLYYSTSGKNNNSKYKNISLVELLQTCDIISIHAPLNENTKNLLNATNLPKIKQGTIFMNFGRGGIVDEHILAKLIDEKDIKVGLDVLEQEPMSENSPFFNVKKQENLVITPHIAWASIDARRVLIEKIALNINKFLSNES